MSLQYIPKKKILLLFGDILAIVVATLCAPAIRFRVPVFEPSYLWPEIIAILFGYLFCFYIADLYSLETNFVHSSYIYRFLIAFLIASGIVLAADYLIPRLMLGRGIFVVNAALILILTFLWRLVLEFLFKRITTGRKKVVLIIGAGKSGNEVYRLIKDNPGINVVGFIDNDPDKHKSHSHINVLGDSRMLDEVVEKYNVDQIIFAIREIKKAEHIRQLLDYKMKGIEVFNMPSFYEQILGKIYVEHLNDLWMLNMPIHGVKKGLYNRKVKRLISIFFSSFFLIITLPIFLFIAIAIKLDSKGPVFYRQKRVGLNGSIFEVVKFRTMKVGMEKDRKFAGRKDDPRITRVGRLIRLARIDEIPQMWNVLKGEMSLIGPRALMVEEVEEFEKKVPYFSIRHTVKPGVTGWAQVNYKHGASVEDALEKLKYDLFYIKNLSPFLDFHILLRTIRVVLFGKGAR
ncbi:MAG: sugar transferase [Syntrophorhabdaceae bacterium]|nr:sugar transferase [Syntrophorhabdaceae bacterium]